MNNFSHLSTSASASNTLSVRRPAPSSTSTPAGNPAPPASYGPDALVRNGAPTSVPSSADVAAAAALDRLSIAFHEDPRQFARNLAVASLNDVCRLVG
jgi:hypothetical protein